MAWTVPHYEIDESTNGLWQATVDVVFDSLMMVPQRLRFRLLCDVSRLHRTVVGAAFLYVNWNLHRTMQWHNTWSSLFVCVNDAIIENEHHKDVVFWIVSAQKRVYIFFGMLSLDVSGSSREQRETRAQHFPALPKVGKVSDNAAFRLIGYIWFSWNWQLLVRTTF